MPLVNVMVNARAYTIACDEGEQEHLKELATHVDTKVRELAGSVGQVGDQKLMLMAAVLITDELFEARGRVDGHAKKAKDLQSSHAGLDARVADAEKRAAAAEKQASRAAEETDKRVAEALSDAENRIAELEALAAKAASDANARVNQMREDAEAQIAEAKRDPEGKGAGASAEAEELAMLELDEAATRVERIVERLKAA